RRPSAPGQADELSLGIQLDQERRDGRVERGDAERPMAERRRLIARALDGDRVRRDVGSGGLAPLAAGGCREDECGGGGQRRRGSQETHCQSAHWTVVTPRRSALRTRIAVCRRGRWPPAAGSARKSGNSPRPKRGRERGGRRRDGTLIGGARRSAR